MTAEGKQFSIRVGEVGETPFLNRNDIYQDGTTPMYRDVDGTLWAMSGHSHLGHIGMFAGKTLDDMKERYPISTNFCVGHADYAFSGIRYPEGVKARGSVWPFGLYICPKTHRFFCFFHNETAWNAKGTEYDALGPCKKPHYDSDFRHIGLMHSDDEGRNWTFDRWVLTAEKVCFTETYHPEEGRMLGQPMGRVSLGSGDFSLYVEPEGEYIYVFYGIIEVNTDKGVWEACNMYAARTRKRDDGVMGDFVKYYDGAFCEAGNFGKETPLLHSIWHPRVAYSKMYDTYLMCSSPIRPGTDKGMVEDILEWRTSTDLLHWSEPRRIEKDGKLFGNHYMAFVSNDEAYPPNVIGGKEFLILTCHNGTDVLRHAAELCPAEGE